MYTIEDAFRDYPDLRLVRNETWLVYNPKTYDYIVYHKPYGKPTARVLIKTENFGQALKKLRGI